MEIFGGFMVMMSIIGLFLSVVWLIMPFVVFAIKGKQDRSLELLESIEKRLTLIDEKLNRIQPVDVSHTPAATQSAEMNGPAPDEGTHAAVLPLA